MKFQDYSEIFSGYRRSPESVNAPDYHDAIRPVELLFKTVYQCYKA